ncbi:MAG: hypothetical protein ACT4OU_10655 [Hyphomicrobium sp.]
MTIAHFIRSLLSFCSMLAFGVMTAGAIIVIGPWLSGRAPGSPLAAGAASLHLESLLLGVLLGLSIASLARFNWAEIPRRAVTWVLVRERQLFYYALIVGCVAVLLYY